MEYTPHNWVVVTVPEGHKLIGGWSGGYLDGDYWRINSGISRVEDMEDHYLVHGFSGSVYHCRKDGEKIRMNLMPPLEMIRGAGFDVVEIGSILEDGCNHKWQEDFCGANAAICTKCNEVKDDN